MIAELGKNAFTISGRPDLLRLWRNKYDFIFEGKFTKNIRLKWLAICLNFNYVNGTFDLFLNGKKSPLMARNPIQLPDDAYKKPLIIRMGHLYWDKTPLIGKVVDINVWDKYKLDLTK